jgi:hypothetical protein
VERPISESNLLLLIEMCIMYNVEMKHGLFTGDQQSGEGAWLEKKG